MAKLDKKEDSLKSVVGSVTENNRGNRLSLLHEMNVIMKVCVALILLGVVLSAVSTMGR